MDTRPTVKRLNEGVGRDGAALMELQREKTAFCCKCSKEKRIVGGHITGWKKSSVARFVCVDCSPPKPAYVPPPTKARPPKKLNDGRRISGERARLVAAVRGDFERLGLTYRQISEARGLSYWAVYAICNYRYASHVEPAAEAA